ncbi:hypothetical protein BWI96_00360 [Siphonobacter sp. SORGH_AS_0500]|uniref:glycosyltransferase family 4 protein n=1 Tax=Siphonobacter sp. SORGH_AS_0500 TaxID=1864824 RepID=UPI000CC2EB70|nr:glycosyltransferase family 1 protein [Siphonobacter sp. SORGH_AS_0500]PKK38283.1 hypothetical protein BWI96_00360 [Siphonobacter sp. SORGH_AS_0500]
MKIGIEAQRIFDPQRHSSDYVAINLIQALQKLDQRNEYFIFARPGEDRSSMQEASNFHVIEIPGYNYLHWEQVQLPRYMRRFKIHVLHSTANTAPVRREVPLVLNLHHINFMDTHDRTKAETRYQQLSNRYRRWIVPRVVDQAELVITVSEEEKQRILNRFPKVQANRVQVVYNGVSEAYHQAHEANQVAVQKRYSLPDQYVLHFGSSEARKNTQRVIEAFARVAERADQLCLVITNVSNAFVENSLAHIHKSELRNRIRILETLKQSDLPGLYLGAKVFIYPSTRESFINPLLEAMAVGVPVITSDLPVMHEIAGQSVTCIEPTDVSLLAESILTLYTDQARSSRLVEEAKQIAQDFTWERTARQMIQIYESFK